MALAEGFSPPSPVLEAPRSIVELREREWVEWSSSRRRVPAALDARRSTLDDKLAAQAGVAPAPSRLTGGWTTVIRLSNKKSGPHGRTCTCDHPVPGRACCCYTTRGLPPAIWKAPGGFGSVGGRTRRPWTASRGEIWRTRRDLHPQPSRRQRVAPLVELRIRKVVGGAGNAPVVASGWFCDAGFTGRQPERLPLDCRFRIADCG